MISYGSREQGLVPQSLHQRDGKVVMTFDDVKAGELAKGILERGVQGDFTSIANPTGYYLVVAKYMDLRSTDEELMEDIRHRNPTFKDHLINKDQLRSCIDAKKAQRATPVYGLHQ